MLSGGKEIPRRRVLKLAAGATVAGGVTVGAMTTKGSGEEYIVGIEPGADPGPVKSKANEVRRELDFGGHGKAIVGFFDDSVGIYDTSNDLQDNVDVSYVEKNDTTGSPSTNEVEGEADCLPWGIDRVDADVAHAAGDTGSGADVAIVDTGIDDDHPDLEPNLGTGKAVVECVDSDCNYAWTDDHDHGTHTAGTVGAADNHEVVGVTPEATLHAVKVLDSAGTGTYADVASGIEYVADQGWDVALLSLGSSESSDTIKNACQYAHDNGVLLVAAAGNDGSCSDCVSYPAAYPEVLAVSATDDDDTLEDSSSTGPEVELAAPGSAVYSTVVDGYDALTGTSMAAPHVAAAGGQLMADGATSTEARDALTAAAEDLGLASEEQGAGLVDVAAALGHDSTDDGTGDC